MPEREPLDDHSVETQELQLNNPYIQPEVYTPGKRELDFIKYVLVGIVSVLFLGLLALVFQFGATQSSSWSEKQSSYMELQNEVHDNNTKVDNLQKEVEKLNNKLDSKPPVVTPSQ